MLVDGASSATEPDPTLIKLILRAQQLHDRMMAERLGVGELAASEGVTAILNGGQPIGLTANKPANDSRLSLAGRRSARRLGSDSNRKTPPIRNLLTTQKPTTPRRDAGRPFCVVRVYAACSSRQNWYHGKGRREIFNDCIGIRAD